VEYREKLKKIEEFKKEKLEDLKKLLNKQEKDKNHINNIFQILNMREDSHTNLLAWLLNAKEKNEEDIQYCFLYNFVEFLQERGYLQNINIENLRNDLIVTPKYRYEQENGNPNYIDLLLYSKEANFVCVIENKLDANVCTDSNGVTQLERYQKYIEEKFLKKEFERTDENNIIRLYLFLSSYDLGEKLNKTVCKTKDKVYLFREDYTNRKFKKLLKILNYKFIEHSDIALILYETLKKYDNNSSNVDIQNVFAEIIKNSNIDKEYLDKLNDKKVCKEKPHYLNINFGTILENKNKKLICTILRQYIEFWEKYNEFVSGYSKIIDVEIEDNVYGVYSIDIKNLLKIPTT